MRTRFVSAIAALSAVVLSARPVVACFEVDAPLTGTVRFTSATTAEVALDGLVAKTGGLAITDYCAVGFGHSGTLITSVSALAVTDGDDPPLPLTEFAFTGNGTTTAAMTSLVPTTTWSGFHTGISAPVAGGTATQMVFTIAFPGGTTYADLETELAAVGLTASDDADTVGNLLATAQEIEAVSALTELPDCFNGVIDAGEVCDQDNNLGCSVGFVCDQCTQCVAQNNPNRCKSLALSGVAKAQKQRLKCYAKAAKAGQPVNPACLLPYASMIDFLWQKCQQSVTLCPLFGGWPSSLTVDNQVDGLSASLVTALPLGGTTGSWKCAANKFKASSLRAVNKIKCYAKARKSNLPVNPLCLSQVDTKFSQAFARAEAPLQCDPGNFGNAASVGSTIDSYVTTLESSITPP